MFQQSVKKCQKSHKLLKTRYIPKENVVGVGNIDPAWPYLLGTVPPSRPPACTTRTTVRVHVTVSSNPGIGETGQIWQLGTLEKRSGTEKQCISRWKPGTYRAGGVVKMPACPRTVLGQSGHGGRSEPAASTLSVPPTSFCFWYRQPVSASVTANQLLLLLPPTSLTIPG